MKLVPVVAIAAIALAGCAPKAGDFSSCSARQPAFEVMDRFMTAFNAKDMAAVEKTFHFPHMRISVYPLHVLNGPGEQEDVFASLATENWARSAWLDRKIVQCDPQKAHMLAKYQVTTRGTDLSRQGAVKIAERVAPK